MSLSRSAYQFDCIIISNHNKIKWTFTGKFTVLIGKNGKITSLSYITVPVHRDRTNANWVAGVSTDIASDGLHR